MVGMLFSIPVANMKLAMTHAPSRGLEFQPSKGTSASPVKPVSSINKSPAQGCSARSAGLKPMLAEVMYNWFSDGPPKAQLVGFWTGSSTVAMQAPPAEKRRMHQPSQKA